MNKALIPLFDFARGRISAKCAALAFAFTVAPLLSPADAVTPEEVISAAMQIIHDEGWTAADVADAIKSVRELYVRDNSTAEGRRRWNGKVIETTVDTNTMVRTTVHENGRVFVEAAKVTTPSQSVAASNAKLKTTVSTNGVPKALAEARLRRQAEKDQGVSNVTVTVTAGR